MKLEDIIERAKSNPRKMFHIPSKLLNQEQLDYLTTIHEISCGYVQNSTSTWVMKW